MSEILAFLLSFFLTSAVASIYGFGLFSIYSIPIFILCGIVFLVTKFTDRKHFVGGIIYILMFIIFMYIINILSSLGTRESEMYFWQWVLNKDDDTPVIVPYLLALLTGAALFLTSDVYYFTKVQYRISFLTLISLMPCVLYVKVTAEIDNIYLVIIAALNILIHLEHPNEVYRKDNLRIIGQKNRYLAHIILMSFVLLISSAIPKQEDAKYYAVFEEIFLKGMESETASANYTERTQFSGNADNYKKLTKAMLYSVLSYDYIYFKRQTFDAYDYENDRWYKLDVSDKTYTSEEWNSIAANLSLSTLYNAIDTACELEPSLIAKYNLSEFLHNGSFTDPLEIAHISANIEASYYLSSQRPVKVLAKNFDDYTVDIDGNITRINGTHDVDFSYPLYYYNSTNVPRNWVLTGASNYSLETSQEMLQEMFTVLSANENDYAACIEAFIKITDYAYEYKNTVEAMSAKTPERIENLSKEITKGLQYDYEKAEAIEKYFKSGDFKYDLKYSAPDNSPEYFLFESKTGTCSDFATAYILLARAAGLSVRYAEGFIPSYSYTDSSFMEITDSSSHAYPEVFIENLGWTVYEPTVGTLEDESDGFNLVEFIKSLKMDFGLVGVILIFIVIISFIVVSIRLIIPMLAELGFRMFLLVSGVNVCCKMTFKRLARYHRELTPGELCDWYELKKCDISLIVLNLEKYIYNNESINPKDKSGIIKAYLRAYKHSK